MSLGVVHAQDSHAMAPGPASMGRGYELNTAVSNSLAPAPPAPSAPTQQQQQQQQQQQPPPLLLPPLPSSQESQPSTVTSKATGLSSPLDAVSDRQLTPTSSQSGHEFSSPHQQQPPPPPYLTSPIASGPLPSYEPLPSYRSEDDTPQSPLSLGGPPSYHVDSTAGQKRTSSGMLKSQRTGSVDFTGQNLGHQRSRTASNASRTSQVGELTAQLRTRLAYAKVKVQHGWESRTLDEIETITSIPTSPASVSANGVKPYTSPYLRDRDYRPVTAPSRHLNYGYPAVTNGHDEHQHQHQQQLLPQIRTEVSDAHQPFRGTLAPPVDFSHPRRTPNGTQNAPFLTTNGVHGGLSVSSASSPYSVSASTALSDQHAQNGVLKTPSQRAMEQDAIETLLFMSSPNNSGTFPRPPAAWPSRPGPGPEVSGSGATAARDGRKQSTLSAFHPPPLPRQGARPGLEKETNKTPISPRKPAIEEVVLASANLHDSQGIDSALDEIRRRAMVEGEGAGSSDEEDGEEA